MTRLYPARQMMGLLASMTTLLASGATANARPPLVVHCGHYASEAGGVSAIGVLVEATPRWLRHLAAEDQHRFRSHALQTVLHSHHPAQTSGCFEAQAVAWSALRWRWPSGSEPDEGTELAEEGVRLTVDRESYECSRFPLGEGPVAPEEWRCFSLHLGVWFTERFDSSQPAKGGPVIRAGCEAAYRLRQSQRAPAYCQV